MSNEREPIDPSLLSAATLVVGARNDSAALSGPVPSEELFAGRYMLLRTVGRGGMGTVYQARDTLVGDVVALKVLELGGDAEAIERFRREVRLARRISHPNVARTFDLGEHNGRAFLTMEFIEGETLQALLSRERALAPARAARAVLAVCEGLAAAHAAGVVHRDLKPANVIVDRTGRVVLTDFGIARAAAEEAASRTVGTVGTPMYMAPEQITGGEVSARTDVYAVGLLLYELLVGEPAFGGESPMAAAFARLNQPPPDARARAVVVPAALAELALRCLAREPAERPESAQEVCTSLLAWLEEVDEPAAPLTPPPGTLSQARRMTPPELLAPPTGSPAPLGQAGVGTQTGRQTARQSAVQQGGQSMAVLPLRFHGPQELDYLGGTLAESLTDVLSRTRGLQVVGSGAAERFRNERDPRVAGQELGVQLLVDGTLQSSGQLLRLSARLVEVDSGVQVWSGRFEESPAEDMEAQDRLAQRISEALRRELLVLAHRHHATPEALQLYRQVHAQAYAATRPDQGNVLARLEECLTLSPHFQPALALHALASVRMSFSGAPGQGRDWVGEARRSLERARSLAPELAETRLACAIHASLQSEWREAVVCLRPALAAAPTFATALQYLGSLQCEAGRVDEGIPRLRLAYALDPNLSLALFEVARCSALRGKLEDYQQALERLLVNPFIRVPAQLLKVRVSAWNRQLEEVRKVKRELEDEAQPIASFGVNYASSVLGEMDPSLALAPVDALLSHPSSLRFASLMCQLSTELLCMTGHPERALTYFQRAASTALIDLEWTDRCVALEPLRSLAGFAEARRQVRARVEAIWSA